MQVNILFIVFLCFGGLMFLVALVSKLFPAKKPNSLYGYRTDRSMRSTRNWKYAQSLLPGMFFRIGLLFVLIAAIWYVVPTPSEMIGMGAFLVVLLGSFAWEIYSCERKLKKFSRERIN